MVKGNGVIGQSGGPTAVINASLAGVIERANRSEAIETLLGMNFGIEGLLKRQFFDLNRQSGKTIQKLKTTPSSALGSSRYKLKESDLPQILAILKEFNIRYFFLIGGNDTMDTIQRVEAFCRDNGYELYGIGIPKTVDNDLYGTDHTPGFPSAARSNILNVKQAGILARDMRRVDQFVIYQTIGRDAGWLAAATALAKESEEEAPHLIYCPERHFNSEVFLKEAEECIKKYGWVSVVVSEGLCYSDGTPVSSAKERDGFGNTEFGAMGGASVGLAVHKILSEATGLRGEFQITESLIMSDIERSEREDRERAYRCGVEAVQLAESGETGFMVTIVREEESFIYGREPLGNVAIRAKCMPDDYITEEGSFVTDKFYSYMRPLISELPTFTQLEPFFKGIKVNL